MNFEFADQKLEISCERRRLLGNDAMPAALLVDVLAQKLVSCRIEDADVEGIPLYVDEPSDPPRERLVGRVHFGTAVQMNRPLAVLVIAERLYGQWQHV